MNDMPETKPLRLTIATENQRVSELQAVMAFCETGRLRGASLYLAKQGIVMSREKVRRLKMAWVKRTAQELERLEEEGG